MIKDPTEWLGMNFVLWFGVVEDNDDPLKVGRVRVRCYGWHSEDRRLLPTNKLPWAQVIMPPTSASMSQVGESPTGLLKGSFVVGFFTDGELAQSPIVLGSVHGIPTVKETNTMKGFADPDQVYPLEDFLGEPDVNRLARNDTFLDPFDSGTKSIEPTLPEEKNDSKTEEVPIANSSDTWDEPDSAYNAEYPKNHVRESESGHVFEVDDTEDHERIHEYHKAGTFYEIDQDGNKVTRIVGDNYTVVAGSDYVNIKGGVNLTIDGDCKTYIKGDWQIQVDGDVNQQVTGDVIINSQQDVKVTTPEGKIRLN